MRSKVPLGNRACMSSAQRFFLPTGDRPPDTDFVSRVHIFPLHNSYELINSYQVSSQGPICHEAPIRLLSSYVFRFRGL